MNIKELMDYTGRPALYAKGTAVMWTDPHISRQLLALHIDPISDAASRRSQSIEAIVRYICAKVGAGSRVLDLGCGPGLYANQLTKAGHCVTGIDFSAGSIAYAKETATQSGCNIDYICADYLKTDLGGGYDIVIMIYCDFGVLSADARQTLLHKVHGALRPGGLFFFDALNERTIEKLMFQRSWDAAPSGFWKSAPYICLTESFHYPEPKAMLDQHIVIDKDGSGEVYRFWNHYFSAEDIHTMAAQAGFAVAQTDQILHGGGPYNDDGVTFYTLCKQR